MIEPIVMLNEKLVGSDSHELMGDCWSSGSLPASLKLWRRIRTNNAIERLNREIRRRTCVVGAFPDSKSALVLVAARLEYVAEGEWGSRRYLGFTLLEERPYRMVGLRGCRKVRKNLDGTTAAATTYKCTVRLQ